MSRLIFFLSFVLPFCISAQVINDNINNRIALTLDSTFTSNTTNCTVQWDCINPKSVTGCILFHNDQWFEFTTRQAGSYFLTITRQNCRDVRGVQVLVLDGEACKPDTYKNITCYSTGSQDDIALTLDSMEANHTYLVNIDGYLNDFCNFDISLQTKTPPFTLFPLAEAPLVSSKIQSDSILLSWYLSDSLKEEFTEFFILKRHAMDKKSSEIVRFPAVTNTLGTRQSDYNYVDTVLKEGVYTYKIIGSSNQQQNYLLKETTIHFRPGKQKIVSPEDLLSFEIPVRKRLNIGIFLFDAQTDELLQRAFMMTSGKNKNLVNMNVANFRQKGIHQFRVLVKEQDKQQGYEKSFFFDK